MSTFQIDFGESKKQIVGIDLGTTNSLVAYQGLTGPEIIPGEDGDRLVPSVVSITHRQDCGGQRSPQDADHRTGPHRVFGEAADGAGPRRRAR